MTLAVENEPPLWSVALTLILSTAATDPEAKEALRGIKARRRRDNPMMCACCSTTLGAAPFTMVMGKVSGDGAIPGATAGVCRRCGPDLEAAGGKAVQIVRGIWPGMAGYELAVVRDGRGW